MKEYCLLSTLVAVFLATSLWAGHLNAQDIFYQLHGILLLGLLDKSSWAFRVIFVVATACLGIRDIFVLLHGVLLLDLLDRCSWAYRATYTVATVSQGTSMASDSPAPATFSKSTQVGEPPAATISTYVETDQPGSVDMGVQVDEPQTVMTTSTATQTVATVSTSTATQTAATVSVAIETQTAPAMSMATMTEAVEVRSVATQPAKRKRKVKSTTASTQTAVTVSVATKTQTAEAVSVATTTETAVTKSVATQTAKSKRKVKTASTATPSDEAKCAPSATATKAMSTDSSTSLTAMPIDEAKRAPTATATKAMSTGSSASSTDKARNTGSSASMTAMVTCVPADKFKSVDLIRSTGKGGIADSVAMMVDSMGDIQMGSTDTGVLNSYIPADDARNARTGARDDDVQMDAEYAHPLNGDVAMDDVNTVARDNDVPMGTADIDSHGGDVPMDSIPTSAQDGDIQMVAAYTNPHDGDIAMDTMDNVGRDDDVSMGAADTDPCDDGIIMDDVEGSVDKASSTLSREQATVNMNTNVPMPLISGGNTEVRAPSFCVSVTSDTIRSPSGNTATIGYSQNTLSASPRGVNNRSWTSKQHSADTTREKVSESTVNRNPAWFANSYMNNPAASPSNMSDERGNYHESTMSKIREWVESKRIEFAASDNFTTSDNIRRTYHDSLANDKLVDIYSRTTTWSLERGVNKSYKAITSGHSVLVARTVSSLLDKQTRHTADTSVMPTTNADAHLSSSQLPTTASTHTLACGTTTASGPTKASTSAAAPATSTDARPSSSQPPPTTNASTAASGSTTASEPTTAIASAAPVTSAVANPSGSQLPAAASAPTMTNEPTTASEPTTAIASAVPATNTDATPSGRQSDTSASAPNTSRASTTANTSATPAKPKNPYSTSMFRTFKKPNGKKPN
ncbi:hypothetical protein GGI13_001133 [Coemansia sp. RSA 455]|nr:hypothetical protein GGI13_001133 [Coemansia sp. RSA 455]